MKWSRRAAKRIARDGTELTFTPRALSGNPKDGVIVTPGSTIDANAVQLDERVRTEEGGERIASRLYVDAVPFTAAGEELHDHFAVTIDSITTELADVDVVRPTPEGDPAYFVAELVQG